MMTMQRLLTLRELQKLADGEKIFRPSSISRLIQCQGSIIASFRSPRSKTSGPAAREGSAAHFVAADVLEGKHKLEEWADRAVDLGDGGPKIEVDEEMIAGVEVYLDVIEGYRYLDTTMLVETKLSLSVLDPNDPLLAENAGTADCIILDYKARKLIIIDLKYGKGIMVAGDAAQLKDYALMASMTYECPGGWAEVITIVVQPRAAKEEERIKPVSHKPESLMLDFVGELVTKMESALDLDAPLITGPSCDWCPAEHTCPARQNEAIHLARKMLDGAPLFTASSDSLPMPQAIFIGTDQHPHPSELDASDANIVSLPLPFKLMPDDIAMVLRRKDIFINWIKSVEHYAAQLLLNGVDIPGWIMVSRSGNRKWKEDIDVAEELRKLGIKDPHAEPKLLSPAQAEKKVTSAGKSIIASLVYKPMGAPTLVEKTDSRSAIPTLMGAVPEDQR